MKKTVIGLIALLMSHQTIANSDDDDDLLLLTIPAIVAGASDAGTREPFAIQQVKLLSGRWVFTRESITFGDYYRFNGSDAQEVVNGPDRGAAIVGEAHIDQNFDFLTSSAAAAYVSNQQAWGIVEPWGPPRVDLGSTYVFTQVGNLITASHFFYIPSTGELSTGIATSSTGVRLSQNFKSIATTQTQGEKIAELIRLHDEEKKLIGNINKKAIQNAESQLANAAIQLINKQREAAK